MVLTDLQISRLCEEFGHVCGENEEQIVLFQKDTITMAKTAYKVIGIYPDGNLVPVFNHIEFESE